MPPSSNKTNPATGPQSKAKRDKTPPARPGDKVIDAQFVAGAMQRDQFPAPAFSEIAFAGRSNVGKSSLMNCLLERRNLVRTSATPGCTRQVSWFRSQADDKSMIDLVDLPGYGYAKRSKSERKHWAGLIEDYLMERATLRGVILLVDVRRGFEEDDLDLVELIQSPAHVSRAPLELAIAATKLDKLSTAEQKTALMHLTKQVKMPVFGFSALSGQGRLPLWRRIRHIAGVAQPTEMPAPNPA
jgi:GTP-binding protein